MPLEERPRTSYQSPAVRGYLALIPFNNLPGRLTAADIIQSGSTIMPRLCLRLVVKWAKGLLRLL
jgi:hypothetical protein